MPNGYHQTLRAAAALVCTLAAAVAFAEESRQREGVDEVVYQVNVNEASADQLQLLYRVGPALAGRIIEEREAGGPFADLADLESRVKGIGARLIACNADFISFAGPTDLETKITCAD